MRVGTVRTSLADEVEASLRELILSGELAPGDRLVELELCADLGASRTPVREALHRLELSGLVCASGRGLCVAALEPAALDDAYRVRAVLEGLAARQAAERQRAGDLAPAALTAVEAAARSADRHTRARRLGAAIAANRAFHLGIVELAANPELAGALVPIWDRIQVTTRAELREAARAAAVDDEHGALLGAIRAGRPGTARRVAEAHVDRTRGLALAASAGPPADHRGLSRAP